MPRTAGWLCSLKTTVVYLTRVLTALRVLGTDVAMAFKGPAWSWLGGVFGVIYISTALIFAPRLGAGLIVAGVLIMQVSTSAAVAAKTA